jgi:hypothetical protein
MKMLPMQLAAFGLVAAALVVAGCGKSSKAESTATTATAASTPTATTAPTTTAANVTHIKVRSGTPLPRTTWIRRGDAICARTNVKLNSTTVKTPQDFARLLPQAAAYDHAEAVELSKLVPPTAMASDWTQVVVGIEKFGELDEKAAEHVLTNYHLATPILIAANAVQKQWTTIAKRDGFKVCSIA